MGTAFLFRNFFAPGFPGLKEEASKCFEQSLGFACSVIKLSKPLTLIHLSFSLEGILWKDSPYKLGIQFFTAHTFLVFMGFLCSVISEILIVKKGEGESVMRIYYVLDTKCIQICNECIRHKMYLNIQ